LLTLIVSLAIVGAIRYRRHRFDRGVKALAALALIVAIQVLSSRSFDLLRLRFTTEATEAWYRATVDAPADLALSTGSRTTIPVELTNAGRSVWDSDAPQPFYFSYHWLKVDSDYVVSWEGLRTRLPGPVGPGETVAFAAHVEAPGQPGDYRLLWDIEQEDRLWFSTEPEAPLFMSRASVTGPAIGPYANGPLRPLPSTAIRPGRLILWRAAMRMFAAHPFTGVGPDNYRLLYGDYAGLANADRRVHSNNMYLEVLAGGGLLIAAPFAWLCWRTVTQMRRLTDRTRAVPLLAGIAAAAAAIALHGLFDSFLSFTPTYILIAIVLGMSASPGVCCAGRSAGVPGTKAAQERRGPARSASRPC
jgi:hypothetical protein